MKKSIISVIGILFLLTISIFTLTACGSEEAYRIVKIFSYTGNCQVIRDNKELSVQKDMKLKNNDELQVSSSSNAILKLDNDKFVNVKENTNVKLEATGKENKTKTRLHILNGGVIVEVKEKLKDDEAFEIASSNSVMAIRGTQISFDVEKTEDSITSTFSILKGETEIFLYKDENMDSTSLIHDYMMSYTTSLIKSTEEIYKIYDRGGFKKLTDDELFEKYGVKKKPISNDRINEIVKSVNDFEKEEDEIVNGVLNFDIPTEISYNVNPKDVVALLDDNRYIDLLNVKFLYSSSIDGTYNEYDSSNPLSVGTWYCKVDAGNAYVSEAIEFSVVKAKVDFEIGNSVAYKTNPNTIITVSGNYSGLKYLYSSTVDGVYAEYSETNPLPTGTYYAKVENDYYTSTPKQFRVTQASISISLLSDSVAYKTNPTTIIKVEGASGTLTYKYGTSRTNLSRTYTASNPLAVGTWYVQVSIGTQTTSNILEFNVVPAKLDASLASDSVEYQTNPSTIVTINGTYNDIKFLYSTSETGEFNEYDTENPLDAGFYYLKVVSGNEYISDILDFEITPKEITFTLGDRVAYGTNPNTIITITNGTYPDATYLYRKAGSTIDVEFDSDSPFTVGAWYVSIDNGSNYTSSSKSFEVVQAEIDYSLTSTSVEYGTNPNTIITINGTYPTVTYKYSTTSTGTYNEFDSANPLAVGTYYVKLFINDNYTSTAKQFSVTKKLINYTISSPITYGENIISYINVTGSYDQVEYYYSTSSSFTNPTRLSSQTVLTPNTYYIKLTSGTDYESAIKSFVITAIEIDYTVPSEIAYATDPSRAIRINGTYPAITYTYSQSATGTFREYSDNNRLTIGTWYVKLTINDGYTAEIKSFDVVKAIQAFELSSTSIPYGDDLSNYITDSLNRNIMISTNGTTYSLYDPADGLSVGTYYIKLENDYYTSSPREITIIERSFNVSNLTISNNYIYAKITTSVGISGTPSFKATYSVNNGTEYTQSLFDEDDDIYYFTASGITSNAIIKIKYSLYLDDEFDSETDYYTIDTSNAVSLSLGTDFELTDERSAFALHTFNSDGTINLYYDLGFVNNTSYNLVYEITYGVYTYGEASVSYSYTKKAYSSDEFFVLLDQSYRNLAICGLRVLNYVDGIYYVGYVEELDYEMDLERPLFKADTPVSATYEETDDVYYELRIYSYETVYEDSGVATITINVTSPTYTTLTFTSENPDLIKSVTVDYDDYLDATIVYTRVINIKSDLAERIFDPSHTSSIKVNDAATFNEIVEAMEDKFGITVKGTYTRNCSISDSFSPYDY